MDSLSFGISTLCCVAKDQAYLGLQTVSGERLPSLFQADHDRWKWRSRPSGIHDHDALEWVITMPWKP
jgi:hypothetical protein